MRSHTRSLHRAVVVLIALVSTVSRADAPVPAGGRTLHVRASAAFAPCLYPVLEAFTRQTGVAAVLDVAEPDPPGDADVVVGDDSELTRLLESGDAEVATAFDLGYLPWVLVAPPGAPVGALAAASAEGISVLGGAAGREARASLAGLSPRQLRLSTDRDELRRARVALVPVSLAGEGERRPSGVTALVATVAVIPEATGAADGRRLLAFLRTDTARELLSRVLVQATSGSASTGAGVYASAVIDYWEPACSLAGNLYNDPKEVLGPPDAANLGGKDLYRGMLSLGQGGWVVVDMGVPVVDGPGPDVRVYQTTVNEPVTLYASNNAAGPFVLVGLRVACGVRSQPIFSNHCDFDLAGAGLAQARYLKVEDGEIYPCLAAGTRTEGADIDAIQALNH